MVLKRDVRRPYHEPDPCSDLFPTSQLTPLGVIPFFLNDETGPLLHPIQWELIHILKYFYENSKEILHKIELAPFCAIHFSVYSSTKGKYYFSNVIPHFKSRLHEVFHKNKMV